MTSEQAVSRLLAPFQGRLLGGLHDSLAGARRFGTATADREALAAWPAVKFPPLDGVHDDQWNPRGEPFITIDALVADLRGDRHLLHAAAFAPGLALRRMITLCAAVEQTTAEQQAEAAERAAVDSWIAMCWLAEATWTAVTGEAPAEPGPLTGDSALLRPVAARTRFLVLSEPMRARGHAEGTFWLTDRDVFGGNGVLDNVFGLGTWPELVGRCREARREWQDCLDAYQSHPLLRQAKPGALEQELRTLVLRDGKGRPLVLSVRPLAEKAPLTAGDTAVITDSVEHHLLPRFAVGLTARLALYDDQPWLQRLRRLLAAAVAMTALAAVGCTAALLIYPAVGLALGCYALIGAGVAVLPAEWNMMWLLRMPAASAVGVFSLISFLPGGWLHALPGGWAAAAVLAAVSFGYLLAEGRSHGVARRASVTRALLMAAAGAVHGLLVTLIGLVLVAPAFDAGGQLGKLWSVPGYAGAGMILTVSTAWCLTVGVFSQILWDDRPITAPLAHLSWRGE
jgi:hypothetical protein